MALSILHFATCRERHLAGSLIRSDLNLHSACQLPCPQISWRDEERACQAGSPTKQWLGTQGPAGSGTGSELVSAYLAPLPVCSGNITCRCTFASELFPVIVPSSIHGSCLDICHQQPSGPVLLPRHTVLVGQAGRIPFMMQKCSNKKLVSLNQKNELEIHTDCSNVFNEIIFHFRPLKTSVCSYLCQ